MSELNKLRLLEEDHRFDKCVCFELNTKLEFFSSDFNWRVKYNEEEEAVLMLSIVFNEETLKIGTGEVRISIRRGELQISLENCKIPLGKRILGVSPETSFLKEQETLEGSEHNQTISGSMSSGSHELSGERSNKKVRQVTEKIQLNVAQVKTAGSPQSPCWIFQAKLGEKNLVSSHSNKNH